MIVNNKTHRFCPHTKVCNSIVDPSSFTYQSSRRAAYMQRLWFEFQYTLKVDGQSFFYTLTYNNKSIPHYNTGDGALDFPCFSYDDIRLVTNGKLSKILLRQYGSRLRYFCACETGEGKGQRGEGFNPHYHFIFFIQPADGEIYQKISPQEFRKLIRELWHGTNSYIRFEDCRFGIAKEGDNCGLISGIAPFRYVSKYVLKDNNELDNENLVLTYWTNRYKFFGVDNKCLWYFYKVQLDVLNISSFDNYLHDLFYWLGLDKYNRWRKMTIDPDKTYTHFVLRYGDIDTKVHYTYVFQFFNSTYIHMMPKIHLRDYINKYSGKVRCSKSLGEYGLQFIQNVETAPILKVPKNGTFDIETPCLYYYRKLYYKQYNCDVTGNTLYRLNDLGLKLKVNSLKERVNSLATRVKENLCILYTNNERHLYETGLYLNRSNLLSDLVKSPNFDNVLRYYAIYTLVYQYRHYNPKLDFVALDDCFSLEHVKKDYYKFISSDAYFYDYDFCNIQVKLSGLVRDDLVSFNSHPSISPYLKYFKVIEQSFESVSRYRSECAKTRFAENKQVSKRINASLNALQ